MRTQILKVTKKRATASERRFMELLKQNHIPFKSKVIINGREVDFLIGKDVIEIDNHWQDVDKNRMLVDAGYTPIHLNNEEIPSPHLNDWLKQKYVRN
jgi:very-short-patch-repair endonuclease